MRSQEGEGLDPNTQLSRGKAGFKPNFLPPRLSCTQPCPSQQQPNSNSPKTCSLPRTFPKSLQGGSCSRVVPSLVPWCSSASTESGTEQPLSKHYTELEISVTSMTLGFRVFESSGSRACLHVTSPWELCGNTDSWASTERF